MSLFQNYTPQKMLLSLLLIVAFSADAQNVGIGTTAPQATLDVKGNTRTGGINNSISYDSASGKIIWTNSNLFVTGPQYLMKHSASSEGLYSNGAQLEYRNSTGNPVFYTNWSNGNGYFSGNLGIGTSSPTAKLQIKDGASGITPFFSARLVVETNSHSYINLLSPDPFETGILFGSGTQAVSGLISYNSTTVPKGFIFNNNGNQTRMVIDNGGNVGIGTTTPATKLEITHNGASIYGTALLINQDVIGNADGPKIQFKKTMTSTKSWTAGILNGVDVGTFVINEDGGTAGFGTPRFTIAQGGNIGIGTSTPLTKLHVQNGSSGNNSPLSPLTVETNANTYINLLSPNTNETGILFGKADNAVSGAIIYNNQGAGGTSNGFQIRVNGNQEAVRIDNAGNMGVGAVSNDRFTIGQKITNPYAMTIYEINGAGNGASYWRIGIDVATKRLYFLSNTAGMNIAFIDPSNGNWVAISDKTMKQDIRPLDPAMEKIMQLKPVSYKMLHQQNDERSFGFLAQELQQVFPDAVKKFGNQGDEKLGISYTHLIPVTVAAIQEQQHIIEKLQQQVDELKKMVQQLMNK